MSSCTTIAASGFIEIRGAEIPLVVDLAMSNHEHQIVINPAHLGVQADYVSDDLAVSAVELEACGLPPSKACETINKLITSSPLKVDNLRTMGAIYNLFAIASVELEFVIEPFQLQPGAYT
ncbi:hypothetical protein [Pseudomonas sp. GOM6]|uniref:hypothetical protein n=1 Tax=Pseudomonas sp. GOM6 TaxID=3036944 RepID=UPI0024095A26|nr:hypothetical protein [Pseudomonas sp. GOM6]MDG1580840.1 hypothetical protein [Pseudomonas sp. GOM6]